MAESAIQVVRDGARGARMGPVHLAVYSASPTIEDLLALNAAHALIRGEFPQRSFGDIDEAAAWVAGHLEVDDRIDPERLAEGLRRLDAHEPSAAD